MMGAIFMVHLPNGFFMNWFGQKAGEGFEFHLLAIGMAVALIITGGGRWSVDRFLGESVD
jgi:putative oxidoreductase